MSEIYGCMEYMHISYDTLMRMPIRQRKYFIKRHNAKVADEQSERMARSVKSQIVYKPYLMNKVAESMQNSENSMYGI